MRLRRRPNDRLCPESGPVLESGRRQSRRVSSGPVRNRSFGGKSRAVPRGSRAPTRACLCWLGPGLRLAGAGVDLTLHPRHIVWTFSIDLSACTRLLEELSEYRKRSTLSSSLALFSTLVFKSLVAPSDSFVVTRNAEARQELYERFRRITGEALCHCCPNSTDTV